MSTKALFHGINLNNFFWQTYQKKIYGNELFLMFLCDLKTIFIFSDYLWIHIIIFFHNLNKCLSEEKPLLFILLFIFFFILNMGKLIFFHSMKIFWLKAYWWKFGMLVKYFKSFWKAIFESLFILKTKVLRISKTIFRRMFHYLWFGYSFGFGGDCLFKTELSTIESCYW